MDPDRMAFELGSWMMIVSLFGTLVVGYPDSRLGYCAPGKLRSSN